MNDITKRKHAESKLAELAIKDDLTALFNRRHFMSILGSEFNRHRRYTSHLSMMFIDVDHFKRINDALVAAPFRNWFF
jgi:diguanylate cyclase (GGDEF)-like protein